jgi:hypothetical protein
MKKHRKAKNIVYIALLAVFLVVVGIRTIQNISLIQKISQNAGIEDVSIESNILIFASEGEGSTSSITTTIEPDYCTGLTCARCVGTCERVYATPLNCPFYCNLAGGMYSCWYSAPNFNPYNGGNPCTTTCDTVGGSCGYWVSQAECVQKDPSCCKTHTYQIYTRCQKSTPTCTPSCAGKTCGDDGCGGSCGSCDSCHTCSGGTCVAKCDSCHTCSGGTCVAKAPNCGTKICGNDACGNSCGTCDSSYSCNPQGQCCISGSIPNPETDVSCPSGWINQRSLGGAGNSQPVVESLNDRLVIAIRGLDDIPYVQEWNGAILKDWYNVTVSPYTIIGTPKLVFESGNLWIYVQGGDGIIYKSQYQSQGVWTAWTNTTICGSNFGNAGPSNVSSKFDNIAYAVYNQNPIYIRECNADAGCDGAKRNGYCSGTETQSLCPADCKTTASMTPNSNLIVGQPAHVSIFFSDGRYRVNHPVKFNLTILPENIIWDYNNYCPYGGVNLSSDGKSGTTIYPNTYPDSTSSKDYNFTTTFTCQIPPGLKPGPHTLLATPIFYSAPITLRAVQVEFTVANNQSDIDFLVNSLIYALKSFLGIK